MIKFWYCSVQIQGIQRPYSYISEFGELKPGTYVEVPFGAENTSRVGVVVSCTLVGKNDVPYPVDKTKHISRIATEEEYHADVNAAGISGRGQIELVVENDDDEDWDDDKNSDDDDPISEADMYIEEEDWDRVLSWAIEHHTTLNAQILEKVIECYKHCCEQHMPIAALNLGTLYYDGRGVPQDYAKACALYEIAAEAGLLRAICNLGYCYYYGRARAVDYAKAYAYFSLGALLCNDANCLYKLGDMYQKGHHVAKNAGYAYRLYERAYEVLSGEGDAEILADVQFRIGKCKLLGLGIEKNIEDANNFLHLALVGFYKRRKLDPFVAGLISSAKSYIAQAEAVLDVETI